MKTACRAHKGKIPLRLTVMAGMPLLLALLLLTLMPNNAMAYTGPTLKGSVGTSSGPQSVYVQGDYAYEVNWTANNMEIYNVSNPLSPVLAGSAPTGTNPHSVCVQGSYAYVVNVTSSTLQTFDVSNPATPTLANSVGTGTAPMSVCIQGAYLYVTCRTTNRLEIYNISNPAAPSFSGSVATGLAPQYACVQGGYAYVTTWDDSSLQAFDVSNPAAPVSAGPAVATDANPAWACVQGDYVYVANQNGGTMQVFDVSNPAALVAKSSTAVGLWTNSVAVYGNYVYVTSGGDGTLTAYDISNPSSPVYAGQAGGSNQPFSVCLQGNYAYVVLNSGSALQVYQIPTTSTVTTTAVSGITTTTADSGGNVTSDGGEAVTARGVCWSTSSNPTIIDSHTADRTGAGSFTSNITGLTTGTLYYVRAYATNSVGTTYGSQLSFTTVQYGVAVSPSAMTGGGLAGTSVSYSLGVTNHGNIPDTFNSSVIGNAWTTTVVPPNLTLAPNVTGTVTVTSSVPAGAAFGDSDSPDVTFTSAADPTKSSLCTITTKAQYPVPAITSISPAGKSEGSKAFTLKVTGSSFVADSRVRWKGANRTTTFVDDNTLLASIPASDVAATGSAQVTVFNPAPGGGVADATTFNINPVPKMTGLTPDKGKPGDLIKITGNKFGSRDRFSHVSFNGTEAVEFKSWSPTRIEVYAPNGATCGNVIVSTQYGSSNGKALNISTPTWYSSEGTTAHGFAQDLAIQNPGDKDIEGYMLFTLSDSAASGAGDTKRMDHIKLKAKSTTHINPGEVVGTEDFSSSFNLYPEDDDKSVVMDRTMKWKAEDGGEGDSTASICANAPTSTWYMPDGSSNWGFETYTLLQNPSDEKALVELTYMIENEPPKVVKHEVKRMSRATFDMEKDIGKKDASVKVKSNKPVLAEQAMYKNKKSAGSGSIGAISPSKRYYMAEGSTAWGFNTYILIQNPMDEATDVKVSFMLTDQQGNGRGRADMPEFRMPANSRRTINVKELTPEKGMPIDMRDSDFSTMVTGTSTTGDNEKGKIIAQHSQVWERAETEYEDEVLKPKGGMHASIGLPEPHEEFYLPGGNVQVEKKKDKKGKVVIKKTEETYICIQNPNREKVNVEVTYMRPDEDQEKGLRNITFEVEIKANARKTLEVGDKMVGEAAIKVVTKDKTKKIVVEKAHYLNDRGGGDSTLGGAQDRPGS